MNQLPPDLIRQCKQGQKLAFRDLVIRVSPFAFSLAYKLLNDRAEAENAVQDSLIKVWKKLDSFDEKNNFNTWLYRIVTHTCFDYLRKMKRKRQFTTDDRTWQLIEGWISDEQNEKPGLNELSGCIRDLTKKLSPVKKSVFVMNDLLNIEQDEIASILDMSKDSVKSNLHYARKEIREKLKNLRLTE